MSADFSLIYRLSVEGAEASRARLGEMANALQRGDITTQQFNKSLREADRANAQVANSVNRATNAFRAAHPNLSILERSMGRIASVGRTLLSIFDSWNILQLAISGSSRKIAEANDEVEKARRKVAEAIKLSDPVKQALAEQELNVALTKQRDVLKENENNAIQAGIQIALMGTVAIGQIPRLISLAGSLTGLAGPKGLGAISTGGAVGIAVAGIILLAGITYYGATQAQTFKDKFGEWPDTLEKARTSVQGLPPVIDEMAARIVLAGGLGGVAMDTMGAKLNVLTVRWAQVSSQIALSIKPITNAYDIWMAHMNILQVKYAQFSSNITLMTGEWGESLRSLTIATFGSMFESARGGINSIIDLLNGFANALNGLVDGYNSTIGAIPGVPRIPGKLGTIPHLAGGGIITGGGMAIVGERGPETVFLPRGAGVAPRGGAGSVTMNFIFPNYVGSKAELIQMIKTELKRDAGALFRMI